MVWERSVRATHHFLTEQDIVGLRPFVAEELASDAYEWWVLEVSDGRVVGLLSYAPNTVEGLFIDPDHRGKGIGTALVGHAQQLSGGVLTVDVNEQNDRARGFYQRLGFVIVGRSPTDGAGRPFPLLHLRRESPVR
jgi:putative acetyltransferase